MIRWNNDYNHGAHPEILKAFVETNDNAYGGYGLDEWCEAGAKEVLKYLKNDKAVVHFLVGGTPSNVIVTAAALRPYQGIISATSGHINSHETGAIENTGHKIHALKGVNGKLTAELVRAEAENYRVSPTPEHVTMPKMVFLSSPSEFGTIYTKQELLDIRKVCDEYGLYMYMDGARMGYGLGADECDYTLEDLAHIVDAFYIGGTKCGAMFGEAVVLINDDLKDHFRNYIKQFNNMLAKGWTMGLQFYTLFKDGLYFEITKKADTQAMRIKEAFQKKGVELYFPNPTNQQFVLLNDAQMEKLGKNHIFEVEDPIGDRHVVRFCTSWATKDSEVDALVKDIEAL